jgi:hypothetical protein
MKCNAATLTALAVTIVSVRASPVQMRTISARATTDPFVGCIQQTYPRFPREGEPTSDEIQACINNTSPQAKRDNAPIGTSAIAWPNESNVTAQVTPRGFTDTVNILGGVLGIGAQPNCVEPTSGTPSTLHDEFVWAREVLPLADAICNDANTYLRKTGFNERGGGGTAMHEFTNAYDDQNNRLIKGRRVLLTLATVVFPPIGAVVAGAEAAKQSVEAVADGVHKVCSAGIQKLFNTQNGCSRSVKWYVSQKARFETELAAIGGTIDVFLGSSKDRVGTIKIGFSQDTN